MLRGYFSAMTEGKDTTVIYVWDVYDPAGTRLHRINGQQTAPSAGAVKAGPTVAPATMQAIADRPSTSWPGLQAPAAELERQRKTCGFSDKHAALEPFRYVRFFGNQWRLRLQYEPRPLKARSTIHFQDRRMKLFAGNSNRVLAEAVARYLNIPLGKASVRRFADQEIFVEIQENVRGEDVFILQSTSFPTNDT
jgi:hypothetical protein